ncbi:MAG: hypothetical protein IH594_03015 [Bacteroidales bacterium]|nr:hypothetical protein [Bacteroidales bacterium]
MEKKPNVIYISADDPGCNALPKYGNRFIEADNQELEAKSITPDFNLQKRYVWKTHPDFNSLFN